MDPNMEISMFKSPRTNLVDLFETIRDIRTPEADITILNQTRRIPHSPVAFQPPSDNSDATELDFGRDDGACHIVHWQDCLAQLTMSIQDWQKHSHPCDFEFLKTELVQYLFTVSVRLRMPNEVRFTAALIVNKFHLRQISKLREYLEVEGADWTQMQKDKEWENIETNLERQIPLRVITAIQISSKWHSYHDSLSSRQASNCLRSLNSPYTVDAVQCSEKRVFQIIGQRVPESPLDACEMALKVLIHAIEGRGILEKNDYNSVWQHVLVVMDVCFIYHKRLYEIFLAMSPNMYNRYNETHTEHDILSKFKWDYLLLASAAVQTAMFCVIGSQYADTISMVLTKLLKCDEKNVRILRESINILLEENNNNR